MKARIISAFLLLVLLLSFCFASCAAEGGEKQSEAASSAATGTDAATTGEVSEITAANLLPSRNFGGATVTFYARSYSGLWTADLVAETVTGDVLNDAVFKRNLEIEELYSVKLNMVASGAQSFYTSVETKVKAGDTSFDVLYTSIRDAAFLTNDGMLTELHGVPNIDLDKSWWNPFLTKQLSIADKIFYATGDITTVDDMSVRTIFFNKTMASDLELGDLYSMVGGNTWTFENMFAMAKKAGSDKNGDGKYLLGADNFGLLAEPTLAFMLLEAADERVIGKDKDDIPYISVGNDRSVDILDYLLKAMDNTAVRTDAVVTDHFMAGTILFALVTMARTNTLRQSDTDFGLLPIPKYDSNQESYIQYSDAFCPNVISFPISNTINLETASFTVEALAIESVGTLTPEFYEICLKTKNARDEESSKMIDIIFGNYTIDLADVYLTVWGNFRGSITTAISGGTSVTTVIRSNRAMVEKLIGQTVDAIRKLGG